MSRLHTTDFCMNYYNNFVLSLLLIIIIASMVQLVSYLHARLEFDETV